MASNTSNFSFILPAVNDPTDEDLWGGYLNTNWTNLDSYLLTARDYITAAKTSDYNVVIGDRNKAVLVDATSGEVDINLLAASTAGDGFTLFVKKTDSSSNDVIIDPTSSETIDGATTLSLSLENDAAVIVCDGSNWYTFNNVPDAISDASTTQKGIVELATPAEAKTGTDNTRAMTPASTIGHEGVIKAWGKIDGSSGSISGSYNISGVTRTTTGTYNINWGTNFGNSNYAVVVQTADFSQSILYPEITAQSAGSITVECKAANGVKFDPSHFNVIAIGSQ